LGAICVVSNYSSPTFCGISASKPPEDYEADDEELVCTENGWVVEAEDEIDIVKLLLWILIPIFVIILIIIIIFATPLRKKIFGKRRGNKTSDILSRTDVNSLFGVSGREITVAMDGKEKTLTLTESIGRGAFGLVWVAECDDDKEKYAVKEMSRAYKGEEIDFKKEMDISLQLNSPYIVHVYGSNITENSFFMVMEYVSLGSLSSAYENYSFSSYMRCRFMLDVAKGMEYLHSQGVIHRDLKPGNVLVSSYDPNSEVLCKISDFGESRKGLEDTKTMTMTRGIGTPYYMAEEILRGDTKYTRAVDVFSYGIMCAELWNERLPYSEKEFETPYAFIMYAMAGNRPQIRQDCPQALSRMISRCWARDRRQRPPFSKIVRDLAPIVNEIGNSVTSSSKHVVARRESKQKTDRSITTSEYGATAGIAMDDFGVMQ